MTKQGKANAALIGLLAKALDVPRSRVALTAGDISRIKRIEIAGNGAALASRLERLLTEHK